MNSMSANDLKRKAAMPSPNLQDNMATIATESPQKFKALADSPTTNKLTCSSNFSSCLIHNRKSWYLTQHGGDSSASASGSGGSDSFDNNFKSIASPCDPKIGSISNKKFSFVYEEEGTGKSDDEENSSEGGSSTKSGAATGIDDKSPTLGEDGSW